jgi:8-amino-7-oxononanoate synthase
LAQLKQRYPFQLLLDEAHASGVYGPNGSGYAAEEKLSDIVDVSIVTLSKAIGCMGGAVCASQKFCESLVNHARAYLYSTHMPAALAAAADASIRVMQDDLVRQQRVRLLAQHVRQELKESFDIPDGDSPIIPVIVGQEENALAMAAQLREKGIFVLAVRPPTVPRGSSRLRITLSCDHTDAEVALLVRELKQLAATYLTKHAMK